MAAVPMAPEHAKVSGTVSASQDLGTKAGALLQRRDATGFASFLENNSPFINCKPSGLPLLVAALRLDKSTHHSPTDPNPTPVADSVLEAMLFGPFAKQGQELYVELVSYLRQPNIKSHEADMAYIRGKIVEHFDHDFKPEIKARRLKLGIDEPGTNGTGVTPADP